MTIRNGSLLSRRPISVLDTAPPPFAPKMKPEIAQFWLAAAESGFVQPDDWRTWADKVILALPKPPYSLGQFLERAGIISDGGSTGFGCEFFYEQLNLLESGKVGPAEIHERTRKEILPFKLLVEKQWETIQSHAISLPMD